MMQSLETEISAFIIFKFDHNIRKRLPTTHLLQQKPKIVYQLSQEMTTVGDIIRGLRAKFAIPVAISLTTSGGALLLPDLPANALTHFSDSVGVELELGEYTTGRRSADGEDVVRHPPPESHIEEDEGSMEVIFINDHGDSGMSNSESDKELDKEKKELARKVSIPGSSKANSFAERARQIEGTDWMSHVRTRQNSLTGLSSRKNSPDTSAGINSSPGGYANEAYGLRRLKKLANDPHLRDIVKGNQKLVTPGSLAYGFVTIEYEDVKPCQTILLKVKKEDHGNDLLNLELVYITVKEVQQDCIKGQRASGKEMETFHRSTMQEINVLTINGQVILDYKI